MNSAEAREADISAADVYLQPHSDDICFSLGAFADARHRGRLLTVFPTAGYVATRPGAAAQPVEQVTRVRLAEDQAFADLCGLETKTVDLAGASVLGHPSFDLGFADDNATRTRGPLMAALRALAPQPAPRSRPWLFCPSGIGGHVDHVTVLQLICSHYEDLRGIYRIGFYEDLHYAADPAGRRAGLDRLHRIVGDRALARHAFRYNGRAGRKLALIALYRSQFLELPATVAEFSPATSLPPAPHEAIWTEEPDGPVA
ncbi:MAG: hypothetical protein P4M07_08415 [Xanthobacteraceae bacterium]|nr:hypothetical protein [Xanthobacteraceae bacterium]